MESPANFMQNKQKKINVLLSAIFLYLPFYREGSRDPLLNANLYLFHFFIDLLHRVHKS